MNLAAFAVEMALFGFPKGRSLRRPVGRWRKIGISSAGK